jgi:hypothetical protein
MPLPEFRGNDLPIRGHQFGKDAAIDAISRGNHTQRLRRRATFIPILGGRIDVAIIAQRPKQELRERPHSEEAKNPLRMQS